MKYIDADKLIAEIERRIIEHKKSLKKDNTLISAAMLKGSLGAYESIERFIASLQQEAENERRKEQKELNKIANQYRDAVIAHIEEKRILPSFKGQLLHEFKNEVNTMRQILGVFNWGNVQNTLFEKFALVFATWGGYHFHPKETESEDSLQREQPEVDLEKEIIDKYSRDTSTLKTREQYANLARHFYELGLNARKEE